jgi:hypothetical protein
MRLKRITSKEGEVYFVNAKTGERITTQNSNWFLYSTPSGVLAFIYLIIVTVILFLIGGLLESYDKASILAYTLDVILISVGCFFIIKINPKSVWYVPLICNAAFILSAIVEPSFWHSEMWIIICPGWVLCIIFSVLGYISGMRNKEIRSLPNKNIS